MEDYINLSSSYQYYLFKKSDPLIFLYSYQDKAVIMEFVNLIVKVRPKVILEIGTYCGGTLFLLLKFSSYDAHLISVDLPTKNRFYKYKGFYKSFVFKKQKIDLFRMNSHNDFTLQIVKKKIKNKQIDVLFIDGDHSHEGVKKDFEMYSPLVKKNGLIVFHDIVPHSLELNCEVNKFWKEIKEIYEYKEIISNWNQQRYGIGILYNH